MSPLFQPNYTERDYAVLRSLFESRVMTRAHLAAIHFGGHARMTKKRVQKLAADGLLGARPRRPTEAKLHFLTKRGYDLLEQAGQLSTYPRVGYDHFRKRVDVSPLTLAHELAVMDVKSAIYRGVKDRPSLLVRTFHTWPLLFRFRDSSHSLHSEWLCPDAFMRLIGTMNGGFNGEQRFYWEIDRSTESLSVLARKASAYLLRAQDLGKDGSFRVLWVFRTAQRRDHAAEMFLRLRPPILTQAWMTVMDELLADPLGPIWVRPTDYARKMQLQDGTAEVTARFSIAC